MFTDLAGQLTTQPYYAPFTMLCQLLYRSAGRVFGQVWLSFLRWDLSQRCISIFAGKFIRCSPEF
ncbi:MAG: hypothetical protein R3C26_26990 [Calditrichia bacterium]